MLRPPETFSTARLTARPPRVADAPEVFATYASDATVTRFLSWKAYSEVAPLEGFLRSREEAWEKGGGEYGWLLFLRDSNELVGSIGVRLGHHDAGFGYVLGQKYWRRGLMAEALTHLVEWSLAQPGIYRAWAFCDTENPASARVMEKAGMQREAVLRRWHICPTIGAEPRDCIVCAKVK
ncbi:MAG: GCN5-related N-acetyltransferase [Verrucomicrobia bacterium]|nr:GCN5-related N-acetyltransferase [Verrucomicrobiota bacterium]